MSPLMLTVLAFIALMVVIALEVPIAFAIGIVAFSLLFLVEGPAHGISVIGILAESTIFDFTLVSVPLFVLMAEVLAVCGIGDDLFDATTKWLAWLPGGLAIAAVWACVAFGAVCGSGTACVAVMGAIAIPAMLSRKYSKYLAFGSVSSSAALAQMIPPSIPLIVFGLLTGESVGKLFIAGIFPGLLLAALFASTILFMARRNPILAPSGRKASWTERA